MSSMYIYIYRERERDFFCVGGWGWMRDLAHWICTEILCKTAAVSRLELSYEICLFKSIDLQKEFHEWKVDRLLQQNRDFHKHHQLYAEFLKMPLTLTSCVHQLGAKNAFIGGFRGSQSSDVISCSSDPPYHTRPGSGWRELSKLPQINFFFHIN